MQANLFPMNKIIYNNISTGMQGVQNKGWVLSRAYTEKRACNSPHSQNHPTSLSYF